MGKIKQKNFKYHSSAPVSMDTDSKSEYDPLQQPPLVDPSLQQLSSLPIQNNVFRNLVIPPSVLKQELPHASTIPKKEKPVKIIEPFPLSMDVKLKLMSQRKLDKKARMSVKKIAADCEKKREEDVKAIKQKKKAVLGDWQSLKDALTEPKSASRGFPTSRKYKINAISMEQRMIQDMSVFYSALQNFSWEFESKTK